MKKVLFPLVSLLLYTACAPSLPVTGNLDDSYLLHVECASDASTRNEILLLLRRARAKDVHTDVVGGAMTVEAAYYKADNDIGVLQEMVDNIRLVGTVTFVEIRDNPRVVRENR